MDQPPDREKAGLLEQAAFFDAHPELITPGYLNNFPEKYDPAFRANLVQEKMHSPLRSPLRNSQALDVFLARLDAATEGIDLAKFHELHRQVKEEFRMAFWKAMGSDDTTRMELKRKVDILKDERDLVIIPAYHRLRKEGYAHYDLCG